MFSTGFSFMETALQEKGGLVPVVGDVETERQDVQRKLEIDKDLTEYFLNLFDKCEGQNEADWLNIKKDWIKCRKYFDNKQYGYVNDSCQWIDYERKLGEVNYIDNQYQGYIQTALTELSRSRPDLSFSYNADTDSRNGRLIARVAEARYKSHRKKLFNSTKLSQENLSKLLNGVAARYTYFSRNGRNEAVPIFGEKRTGGVQSQVCSVCGASRKAIRDANEPCKTCGSTYTKTLEVPEAQAKVVTGYDQVNYSGCNDWVSVDPLGLLFYLGATTVAETPYIIWKQVIVTDVLQAQYPDKNVEEGVQSPELMDKTNQSNASPLDQILGGSSETGTSELVQGWFDTSLYANRELKAAVKLRNGMTFPAGMKLGEAFPNGVWIAKNGKKLLDIAGENKNDKWTIAPYVSRIGTMVGAGTTVVLSNQDIKNDLRNLHMASIFQDAFRKEFVRTEYIEGENIPNDPTERARVINLPAGERIVGSVIDALPPSNLASDAYTLEERIDQSQQFQMGAFSSVGSGAPDLKAVQDTATGFLAYREIAVGRYAPMLMVSADALDAQQAYQLLLNDQKYLSPQDWEQIKGEYGADGVKLFLNCDIRKDILIEVVPDSYMPMSTTQEQGLIRAYGDFIVNTQIPPNSELGAYAGQKFRIPEHLLGFDAQYEAARTSIEAYKDITELIIQQFGDAPSSDINVPQVAMLANLVLTQANIPVNPEMENVPAIIEAYKDWWITDEGRNASNLLKATITLRVKMLKGGMAEMMAEDQQLAMVAQAPTMQMQQDQMAQQNQTEQASAEQATKAETEARGEEYKAEAMRKAVDLNEKEADREFQSSEADKQRAHELKMAKLTKPKKD